MPAKNSVKAFVHEGYYHVYNRGVEKRLIFQDNEDYAVFLNCLKYYLSPKLENDLRSKLVNDTISKKERDNIWHQLRLSNYSDTITLIAYCLMPNHYHLLVKQHTEKAMSGFMSSLGTRYTMYFNKKYKRTGTLFEGIYKAVLVDSDPQLLELTKYIHKQAISLQGCTLQGQQPSSYDDYIGMKKTTWVHPEEILIHFSNLYPSTSYENFVNNNEETDSIQKFVIE
jgi:putative transposase